jgi:hypothetical protein
MNDDMVIVEFEILDEINYFRRYPDSLVTGLARIGGILALLKLGSLLQQYHQHQFSKSLRSFQSRSGEHEATGDDHHSNNYLPVSKSLARDNSG